MDTSGMVEGMGAEVIVMGHSYGRTCRNSSCLRYPLISPATRPSCWSGGSCWLCLGGLCVEHGAPAGEVLQAPQLILEKGPPRPQKSTLLQTFCTLESCLVMKMGRNGDVVTGTSTAGQRLPLSVLWPMTLGGHVDVQTWLAPEPPGCPSCVGQR